MRATVSIKDADVKRAQAKADRNSNVVDIPKFARLLMYAATTLVALTSLVPLLLTFIISITDNQTLALNGYSFIPTKFSMEAYLYIAKRYSIVARAYGISALVTTSGTILGLLMMTMFAYVISRKHFPWRNQFAFFIYFTMLFHGGTVPTYIVLTQFFGLRDTIWALILPMSVNVMYILILRTYMSTSIPAEVEESAKIDGAGDYMCYFRIILPMAVPSIMTIALFLTVAYWNDWFLGFMYILKNDAIIPIQLLLKRIENDLQYLGQADVTGMSALELDQLRKNTPTESFKMALVMCVIFPILISYPFFQRFFVKGITIGAVKG